MSYYGRKVLRGMFRTFTGPWTRSCVCLFLIPLPLCLMCLYVMIGVEAERLNSSPGAFKKLEDLKMRAVERAVELSMR